MLRTAVLFVLLALAVLDAVSSASGLTERDEISRYLAEEVQPQAGRLAAAVE